MNPKIALLIFSSLRRLRFRGSKREIPFGRILTPALSRWEREKRSPRPGKTTAESSLNADEL
jgi:hypothetical protein